MGMEKYKRWCIGLLSALCTMGVTAQSNYDYARLQKENLNRGVVAIRENASKIVVSWRYVSSDPMNTSFHVYRDSKKIATVKAGTGTFYVDTYKGNREAVYEVKPVVNGKETHHLDGVYTLPADAPCGYLNIPLDRPADGVTPVGDVYSYSPNDASIGDVDGDGEYEIILKWDPSNGHDNSHAGYTGNTYFDCYKLNGKKLWRIDLGHNIRSGAHYIPFIVYDLDGDGKAELVVRTSDGAVDGQGQVIGDTTADYREKGDTATLRRQLEMKEKIKRDPNFKPYVIDRRRGRRYPGVPTPYMQGRIIKGREYLTVFNGETGAAMQSIDYVPERGKPSDWGDGHGNRSDRFLACVGYLDGRHPSVVMCRGYYTRTVLAAFDWDGQQLKQRWVFDSNNPGYETYSGQGNHNLRVGDVDGDGCDEIVYGSCAIDHDGKGLYSTQMGHGDAIHLMQFAPDLKGLQVFDCHENRRDGTTFRNAATGEVIWQIKSRTDVGRCMAADIDPTNYGVEMWSWETGGLRNVKGELVTPRVRSLSTNMAVWWDGDLLRELLDRNAVSKYNWKKKQSERLQVFEDCVSNNGTKSNPCLQGDIIGDWREEVLLRTSDNTAMRLYVTTIPTKYRFHTFLEEPVYRISIATENVGYNQPTQPGFYFGPDLKGVFRGYQLGKE